MPIKDYDNNIMKKPYSSQIGYDEIVKSFFNDKVVWKISNKKCPKCGDFLFRRLSTWGTYFNYKCIKCKIEEIE